MNQYTEDWHAKKEKQDAYVQDFIEAKPGSVSDSADVLKARLFGLGLRGEYLESEVRQAVGRRAALQHRDCMVDTKVDHRNPTKNWNCDNNKCWKPDGEVRLYPTGGGGNMILCRGCWMHENTYRASRGGERSGFPLLNWDEATVYKCE